MGNSLEIQVEEGGAPLVEDLGLDTGLRDLLSERGPGSGWKCIQSAPQEVKEVANEFSPHFHFVGTWGL